MLPKQKSPDVRPDDLGDARSRAENAGFRDSIERRKAENPLYAYAPRWVPNGNWRMSIGDVVVAVLGLAVILMVVGMRLFGVIG